MIFVSDLMCARRTMYLVEMLIDMNTIASISTSTTDIMVAGKIIHHLHLAESHVFIKTY